jgi:hypothetical protein
MNKTGKSTTNFERERDTSCIYREIVVGTNTILFSNNVQILQIIDICPPIYFAIVAVFTLRLFNGRTLLCLSEHGTTKMKK